MTDRFLASIFAGLIGYMGAVAAGLPAWRHWPIGDAADFGACFAFLTWFALKALAGARRKGAPSD